MPPMSDDDVMAILAESGALLEGHFCLTSGRHSNRYFQAMKLLQHPGWTAQAAAAIAAQLGGAQIDATLAPAVGGIVWGWAVAQATAPARALFAERVEGVMTLRRAFEIRPGESILLAEDVITTGGSVLEVKAIAEAAGARVAGVACVLDRSGGKFDPGVPVFAWARLTVESWPPEACPLCALGSVAVKPGSRGLARDGQTAEG